MSKKAQDPKAAAKAPASRVPGHIQKPLDGGFAVPQNLNPGAEVVKHVSAAPCSIEFSRGAKGEARWTIKVFGEVEDLGKVRDRVLELDRDLARQTNQGPEGPEDDDA